MNVLLWHVHGSWTTAFLAGAHRYLLPVIEGRGPDGRGRASTWQWPDCAVEVTAEQASEAKVDIVVLQRPHELDGLCERWLGGRRPGRDVPAIYLEHNAPQGRIAEMRHPAADRPDLHVVHVTHFNALFWDCGSTPSTVIEHGIPDPGPLYSGELPRLAAAINEASRRGRVTGTDLLARFADVAPLDLFGIDSEALGGLGNLAQADMLGEIARRRVYLHPIRWTSLGLSLIEAMHMGMPVVALATTEAPEAVQANVGVLSTDVERLVEAARALIADPEAARTMGMAAREAALERFGLQRFLADWDRLMADVASRYSWRCARAPRLRGRQASVAAGPQGPGASPAVRSQGREASPAVQSQGREASPAVQSRGREASPAVRSRGREASPA